MPLFYLRRLTGSDRTEQANRHLARYLAFIAGAVNAGGFLAVRQYTSHMSGIVAAMADNLALGSLPLVLSGGAAVLSFLAGAFFTTLCIRWARSKALESEYALSLIAEAVLLVLFGMTGEVFSGGRVLGTVMLLCFTMGLQNATITKISNAVIRTTHITGMVTDVGIALGRISDRVSRKGLMAAGLAIWSVMTALGGTATSFLGLSLARVGVGVGEATATPCSHSLIGDIIPQRLRASALAVYHTGTYGGAALSLIIGALFVQHWGSYCHSLPITSACTIAGWRAALMAVALPGLPIGLLLLRLREPPRTILTDKSRAFDVAAEFAAALPPLTVLRVYTLGGWPEALKNLAVATVLAALAALLSKLCGDPAQWTAAALGTYAVYTWGQVQKLNDRPLYALTFGCKTFVAAMLGAALLGCIGGGISAWTAPFAMRSLGLSPVETGMALGLLYSSSAVTGVVLGGWITDRWKRRDVRAPIWMACITLIGELPFLIAIVTAHDKAQLFIAYAGFALCTSLSVGAFAAKAQDLVL